MAAGEERDEQFVQHFALPDDDLAKLAEHALVEVAQGVQLRFNIGVHAVFSIPNLAGGLARRLRPAAAGKPAG
jgi:hypothetical protein